MANVRVRRRVRGTSIAPLNWYDWGAFTSMTETRRNISGTTVNNAPVEFIAQFHKGELPTSKWFQLRGPDGNLVASTDWQANERVTYSDGSLMACVVRCYGPSGWTDGADKQWTLEAVTSSWPAETDSRATSVVTGGSDININLSGIRRIAPQVTNTTQGDHTYTTLTGSVNYGLGLTQTRKEVAGNIFTRWYTWAKFRNGSNNDSYLWWKGWIDVWFEPGTNTIRHLIPRLVLNNGWANVDGRALVFKATVTDGGTTLIDYTATRNIVSGDIDTTNNTFISGPDLAGQNFLPGTVAYVASGTPPTGVTVGKAYPIKVLTTTDGQNDGIANSATRLGLGSLGYWDTDPTGAARVDFTDTGGNWAIESWIASLHRRPKMFYDHDGWPLAAIGGAKVVPNWTRAEKIRRMQTGQILNAQLDDSAAYTAHSDRRYFPGAWSYHRTNNDDPGGFFQQGYQIGEMGVHAWNVIQDMGTAIRHKILRRAAAEAISAISSAGVYESETNGATSAEYAEFVCANNGADKAGASYSGLGTPRPGLTSGQSWAGNYGIMDAGNTVGDEHFNYNHNCSGGIDGTHGSQAMSRAYEFYPDPVYREMALGNFTAAPLDAHNGSVPTGNDASAADAEDALLGLNKRLNNVKYFRVFTTANWYSGSGAGRRTHIGALGWLKCANYIPDNVPLGPYVRDIVKDNVQFIDAFYDDSSRIGSRARIIGPMTAYDGRADHPNYSSGGSQQHWQQTRQAAAALYILKASGIQSPNALKWFTGMSRAIYGDPASGTPMKQARPGNLMSFGIVLFDKPQLSLQPFSNSQNLYSRFEDAAATTADAETLRTANYTFTFGTDGQTVTLTSPSLNDAAAMPVNGDDFTLMQQSNATQPPTGLVNGVRYWLYDRAGSGTTRTYKISSTAGPSYTQATWVAASPVVISEVYTSALMEGTYAGGRYHANNYGDYNLNCAFPVTAALTMFGAPSGCGAANTNFETLKSDLATGQNKYCADPSRDGFYIAFNCTKYHPN